jgi:hypothetical protein
MTVLGNDMDRNCGSKFTQRQDGQQTNRAGTHDNDGCIRWDLDSPDGMHSAGQRFDEDSSAVAE